MKKPTSKKTTTRPTASKKSTASSKKAASVKVKKKTKAAPKKATAKAKTKASKSKSGKTTTSAKKTTTKTKTTTTKKSATKAAASKGKAAQPKVSKAAAAKVKLQAEVVLNVGDRAPALALPAVGRDAMSFSVDLRDYIGKQAVVLYFYPKDDTSGCTKQACDLRDNWARLQELDVAVFGVSPDGVESHVRFAQKYELPYTLLADTDTQAANSYGVWVEKNMYGRKYFGIQRSTFLIDKDGIIAALWPKVSVEGHIDDIIEAITRLQRGG